MAKEKETATEQVAAAGNEAYDKFREQSTRLECLKLAVALHNGDSTKAVPLAKEFEAFVRGQ